MTEGEELVARLDALRRAGASEFDPAALRMVEVLQRRATELPGVVRAHLTTRALARIGELERTLEAARSEASARIAELEMAGGEDAAAARAAFLAGDYRGATTAARRAARGADDARLAATRRWLSHLAERARERAVRLPDEVRRDLDAATGAVVASAPGFFAHARALGEAVSTALFRESVDAGRAAVAAARATDRLPDTVGPYNAEALTARVLAALAEAAPTYLHAYLAGLHELASIDVGAAPEPAGSARERRRGRSGPSSRRR